MRRVALPVVVVAVACFALLACETEEEDTSRSLEETADLVMQRLQDHRWDQLSDYVHPKRGVTFSPNAYVDPESAVTLSREQVRGIDTLSQTFVWGADDGTGDPIEMVPSEYMSEYVSDRDFADAARGRRDQTLGVGNTMNNLPDAFYNQPPGANTEQHISFLEYHLPGSQRYGGMDWASLRLVFERENDDWYLIGVVRDGWTI